MADEERGTSGVSPLNYASPGTVKRPGRPLAFIWQFLAVVVVLLLLVAAMLPNLGRAREPANRAKCANNLRQIGLACMMYANANSGHFPDTLNQVLLMGDLTAQVFTCPTSTDTPAMGPTTQATAANLTAAGPPSTGGHLSYIYVGKGLTNTAGPSTVLAYEPLSNHNGAGMNIVYADGSVQWENAATAAKIIAELNAGQNPPRPDKLK